MNPGWRDRLALHRLWLRHSAPFRWSHKPWCERFEEDTVGCGKARLCRSCLCVLAGLVAAGGSWILLGSSFGPLGVAGVLDGLLVTLLLSYPGWYKRWPRGVRDGLRFALGFFALLSLLGAWSLHPLAGTAFVAATVALHRMFKSLRQRQKERACDGCPELGRPGICSGFRAQAGMIRAYEEAASAKLLARQVRMIHEESAYRCTGIRSSSSVATGKV